MSKKPRRVYLDSMVFIFGRLEECNSRLVLFLAQLGEFEVVTSELVIEEVERFFRENFSREAAFLARNFVQELSSHIVRKSDIKAEMDVLKGKIKDKDLENVAAVRHENLIHLVAYDKDYEEADVREYITPKDFVKLFKLEPYDKEY
ncbi:MAG: hypothetical protein AOA65_1775 [Candidatus Bathyarchaeota archaeon BA1]|nr:MAG: hypothetical protein AOA65_1775 [Candidatus Bathyarchaeota archaeon BA1]